MLKRGEIIKAKSLFISLIMLCIVICSVSATFAADDVADAIAADDEISVDEPLAVDETPTVSEDDTSVTSDVVTKDNFKEYFTESGTLNTTVNATELTFKGEISDVGVDAIVLDRPIKITGENSTFTNVAIDVKSSDVVISGLTINEDKYIAAISVLNATNVTIEDTEINYNAVAGADGYAIYADLADNLKLIGNSINYVGATSGWEMNNGIRVSNSPNATIKGNKFNLTLVSTDAGWAEVPAGSGNWVSSPISEGIVVDSSDYVVFKENIVDVTYNDVVTSFGYDTIYSVDFRNSANATIYGNEINSLGHDYVYGIIITGDYFNIVNNTIYSESDVYYANGIDVEGPASGVIYNNSISAKGIVSAYAIYSGMNGQNATIGYGNNIIGASAYLAFGMSLGDVESLIYNNTIVALGNYTMGIASVVDKLMVVNNKIWLYSSEQGNESIWEGFGIETNGIKILSKSLEANNTAALYNNTILTSGKGINLGSGIIAVLNNEIMVTGNEDADAYAVYATDLAGLYLNENNITYEGKTNGTGINNAIYLNNVTGAIIEENNFDLALVSAYVNWVEEPAGSWNYVGYPISEGILIKDSDNAVFNDNTVKVNCTVIVGTYDTIYAIDFKNSDNATISGNDIDALGFTYIYGIIISGDNFTISENDIATESAYYANGIDVEGPATGVIEDNGISAKAPTLAYPIYSGMNYQPVSVNYTGNDLIGDAYLVIGMSLGDVESNIVDNDIILSGNYTTGIAYGGSKLTVDNNMIVADGSNVGNESIWESFGVDTVGIKVVKGDAEITFNNVETTGNFTVDVKDTNSSVHDNYLKAAELFGDDSVSKTGDAEVYNNTPVKTKARIAITEVDGDCTIIGLLTDDEGNPLAGETVNYIFNGTNATVVTEDDGTFKLENLSNGEIGISYDGKFYIDPTNTTITLKGIAPIPPVKIVSMFKVTDDGNRTTTINGYAVDGPAGEQGIYYATTLIDENGNPIPNVYIEFAVNNKIYNRTTYENGSFVPYKLNMVRAGRYTMAFNFAGDENYTNAFACVCVDLDKKPIKIKASSKSYKAATKTKKYTVTLSTIKGLDGKMYLSPKAVSLKVNGKTYVAKTNSKGVATFKITNLTKKAKYSAVISYDGDKTYDSASKKVTITVK